MSSEEKGLAVILGANGGLISRNFMIHLDEQRKLGREFPFELVGVDTEEPHGDLYHLNGFDRWVRANMVKPSSEARGVLRNADVVYQFIMAPEDSEDHLGIQLNTTALALWHMNPSGLMVQASSNSIFCEEGLTHNDLPELKEDTEPRPIDPRGWMYPLSKTLAEHTADYFCNSRKELGVVSFRITQPEVIGSDKTPYILHEDFGEYLWRVATVSDERLFGRRKVKHRRLQLCHPAAQTNAEPGMEETEEAIGYKCQYPPEWTSKKSQ